MRQPSIVIHKGRKEEKYELYVEDYVISFLRERRDMPDTEEILFYGCREKGGRRYTIYGAGLDRHLAVFDKYELLGEIGCRLTHVDPVFLIREGTSVYEIKGYKVFYYENEEMQNYLIHQDMERNEKASFSDAHPALRRDAVQRSGKRPAGHNSHYLISLQLGLVFVVLVAIVINSSNSYDKMEQLNQSAAEVFFVMENQETGETTEIRDDIIVERETPERSSLQDNVLLENEMQGQPDQREGTTESLWETEAEDGEGVSGTEADQTGTQAVSPENVVARADEDLSEGTGTEGSGDAQEKVQASLETDTEEEGAETASGEAGVEALSRNVARYYEVERGDTLYMISKKVYGDTSHVRRICEVNQITDPDNICYGQKIILP